MSKQIQALAGSLDKKWPGKVMMACDIPIGEPISTGSLALDFATGFGGFPNNRVVEIFGREGVGKTTLALLTMVNALEKYPERGALFLDLEHKVTPEWMEMIVGRELMESRIIYLQPVTIEQATNMYVEAVGSDMVCCAVLDSIGGAPSVRTNDDAEVARVGGNSMGVGAFARAATSHSAAHNCLTIGINQVREVVGARIPGLISTPGGKAWKHHCILRIELARGRDVETIKVPGEEKPVPIGYTIMARIKKNQVGPEGRTAYWWFFNVWTDQYGFGIDQIDEVIRLSLKTQVVLRSGGWYNHAALPDGKVQGLPKFQELVRGDQSLRDTLVSEVLVRLQDHAGQVAPLTDPNTPIEDVDVSSSMMNMYLDGESA